jgi:hypothetical protein
VKRLDGRMFFVPEGQHEENSLVDDKNCGTDNDFNRPSGRGLSASIPRHFVPGYHRAVPPGQKAIAPKQLRDTLGQFSGAVEDRRQSPPMLAFAFEGSTHRRERLGQRKDFGGDEHIGVRGSDRMPVDASCRDGNLRC